jgi:hypothetical protein
MSCATAAPSLGAISPSATARTSCAIASVASRAPSSEGKSGRTRRSFGKIRSSRNLSICTSPPLASSIAVRTSSTSSPRRSASAIAVVRFFDPGLLPRFPSANGRPRGTIFTGVIDSDSLSIVLFPMQHRVPHCSTALARRPLDQQRITPSNGARPALNVDMRPRAAGAVQALVYSDATPEKRVPIRAPDHDAAPSSKAVFPLSRPRTYETCRS